MLKLVSISILILSIAGCALTPKKEYEWLGPNGNLATNEQVKKVKDECEYDKKMKEAADLLGIAISIGRYESQYGPKKSDEYVNKASKVSFEAATCIREKGYRTREKVKSQELRKGDA